MRVSQLLLAVFIGGGTGSVARWFLSMRFNPMHQAIPMGTLAANLIGAFIIGFAVTFFASSSLSPNYKLFLITGFCGALTTFSTFSIEVVSLLQSGKFEYAILTITVHILGSLLFTLLGIFTYQLTTIH